MIRGKVFRLPGAYWPLRTGVLGVDVAVGRPHAVWCYEIHDTARPAGMRMIRSGVRYSWLGAMAAFESSLRGACAGDPPRPDEIVWCPR